MKMGFVCAGLSIKVLAHLIAEDHLEDRLFSRPPGLPFRFQHLDGLLAVAQRPLLLFQRK